MPKPKSVNYPTIWPRSGDVCFQSSISLHLPAKAKTLPKLNIFQVQILLKPPSRMVPIPSETGKIINCHINVRKIQVIIISDNKYENAAK